MTTYRTTFFYSLIITLFLFFSTTSAQDVAQIYKQSKQSIVLIISQDKNQTPLALGTGFYFKKNLIVTNYHVIEDASSFVIKNIGSEKKFTDAKVKSYSEKLDIALLEVKQESTALPLADETKQEIGKKVVAIGNPKGLEGSVSTGIISGIRKVDKYNIYQITAPISPGSSGGPVFDETGAVIGIATFTIEKSQNVNFAMPASLLIELENKKMKWEPSKDIEEIYKKGNAGVEMTLFKKLGYDFEEHISLKNTTQNTVKNITYLIIYKTKEGEAFNFQIKTLSNVLPPGFAKMMTYQSFDQHQNFIYHKDARRYNSYEIFTIEIRILSYDIVEEKKKDDIFEQILK